jgi:hypothetical protein
LIPAIVDGIHRAFTIGVTAAFQLGVITTILAAATALFLKEIPLRTHTGEAPVPAGAPAAAGSDAAPVRPLTGSPSVD